MLSFFRAAGTFTSVATMLVGLNGAAQDAPKLTGCVTDAGTPAVYTVNSTQVVCNAYTENVTVSGDKSMSTPGCPQRVLGERVRVFGKEKLKSIAATRVEADAAVAKKISGFAIIDRRLINAGTDTATVRADGYVIHISPATKSGFIAPLKDLSAVAPNMWIRYQGMRREDGSVAADYALLSPNVIAKREDKLKTKNEFDPASVDESDRQSVLSIAFIGFNPKKIPAHNDPAMQQRVETLAKKLIPEYQRELPDDDPTKINFRFQVVDQKYFRDALALASGIILIPYQVVERTQNDSQLATVLADNIATVLEKQALRYMTGEHTAVAAEWAALGGEAFVPGVSIATSIAGAAAAAAMVRRTEEQSGRVSLDLLSDAGFDIKEAPVTWWLLASNKPKSTDEIAIPYRAQYLYGILGTAWRGTRTAGTPLGAGTSNMKAP